MVAAVIGGREILPRRALAAALALAALAACGAADATGAIVPAAGLAAARGVLSEPVAESTAAVRSYWTAARMRAARPADLMLDDAGNLRRAPARTQAAPDVPVANSRTAVDSSGANAEFPGRVHGKVFFSIEGGSQPGDFVCSATVVTSGGHTLVWTAGHCVIDSEFGGGFATRWAFVPGYRNGQRPFGTWAARRLFSTKAWGEDADSRQDLGAARVARDGDGHGIEDVVGARQIEFSGPKPSELIAYGYPAQPSLFHLDFDGEHLFGCASPITGHDNPPGNGPPTLQIDCDMTGGSSGGGWVTAAGAIDGVTSYGYAGDLEHLYGPYLGVEAKELYTRASARAERCAGAEVTNLGGPGATPSSAATAGTPCGWPAAATRRPAWTPGTRSAAAGGATTSTAAPATTVSAAAAARTCWSAAMARRVRRRPGP